MKSWFRNMKIRGKLVISFLLVAAVVLLVGSVGTINLSKLEKSDTELYENMTEPLSHLVGISTAFQRVRVNLRDMVIADDPQSIQENSDTIAKRRAEMDEFSKAYEKTILSEAMRQTFEEFMAARKAIAIEIDKLTALAKENKDEEALLLLAETGSFGRVSRAEQDLIEELVAMKIADAQEKIQDNTDVSNAAITMMVVMMIVGMVLAIGLGLILSRVISNPLIKATEMIKEMGKGHLGMRLNNNNKDEIGQMSQDMDQLAEDLQHKIVATMDRIAAGDLAAQVEIIDDQDEISPALKQMIETIRTLINEMTMLSEAAIKGVLSSRGASEKFSGGYKEIVQGVNKTLDAVVEPMQEVSATLKDLVSGNLKTQMTGDYNGDFRLMKEDMNATVAFLKDYIGEITAVLGDIAKGQLDTKMVGNYKGDYLQIKLEMNKTIDFLKRLISEINDILDEMGRSNLDQTISSDYPGDFLNIKTALNKITQTLSDTILDIDVCAGQVEIGSQQISSTGEALSQGATEQASSIEELTASVTEVAEKTKKNALSANQANELAEKVHGSAAMGNQQMGKMLVAMGDINESSQNISKIIKVIDDIAFQTNILALNAAVEAARAGQYGKGFAVVAEEVRSLAARSAEAAKETANMIEGSIQKVGLGSKIADETEDSLKEILGEIEKVTSLVAAIAQSSNEQASEVAQINQGIEQVSIVVQTNSASAEESAAASEELTGQAIMLKEMVDVFVLKGNKETGHLILNDVTCDPPKIGCKSPQ